MTVATNNIVLCSEILVFHVRDYVLLLVTPGTLKMCTDFLVDHTVFLLMVEL